MNKSKCDLISLCLLDQGVKLSAMALSPWISAFCHDDHELPSETIYKLQFVSSCKSSHAHGASS